MQNTKNHITILLWAAISVALYVLIGFYVARENSLLLLSSWSLLFIGYFYIIKKDWNTQHLNLLLGISIIFRLCLLTSYPALSDDYFRFIWDGEMLIKGVSPFLYKPSEVISGDTQLQSLYAQLNSPHYYSIYPPIMQYTFWFAQKLAGNNILAFIIIVRAILIAAEAGSIYIITQLLKKWTLPVKNALLYALNPLIVIELTGNLHYESLMIFFVLLSVLLLSNKRVITAGLAFGAAVCVKLVPLILLPIVLKKLKIKEFVLFTAVATAFTVILFGTMLNGYLLSHMLSSVKLYFQNFEFNASVFYIIRAIGFGIKGYDIISTAGKVLPFIFACSFLLVFLKDKQKSIASFWQTTLWVLLIYYALALVVHPWYLSLVLLSGVFTRYRFPLMWTALAGFTYITYATIPYQENLWIVSIEYVCVYAFMAIELSRNISHKQLLQ